MIKKLTTENIVFSKITAKVSILLGNHTFSSILVTALMMVLAPVAWAEQTVFSITADGKYNRLRSGNSETRVNNQVQLETNSIPITNPGAELGDITGWFNNGFYGFDAINSPVNAYSGDYYFGFDQHGSIFPLEMIESRWRAFGKLSSGIIDLSSFDQILTIPTTAFAHAGDIKVEVKNMDTGEIFIFPVETILSTRAYDEEDNYLLGVGYHDPTDSEWGQIVNSYDWREFASRIDHITIGLETFFYIDEKDIDDESLETNNYEIVGYSWTGADGIQYFGDMSDYSGGQLPIVGFDDVNLEVETGNNCSTTYTLPSNQWQQIALPCDPGTNNSVEAVFGDDSLGLYGTEWKIYRFNTANNSYDLLQLDDILNQGEGHWIIQSNETPKILTMPAGSIPTATTNPAGCNNDEGCFPIPLTTKSNDIQWNMIGFPFEYIHSIDDTAVTDSEGCIDGCTLSEANSVNIIQNELWTYANGSYTNAVTDGTLLNPWKGYWIQTLESADDSVPINLLMKKSIVPLIPF